MTNEELTPQFTTLNSIHFDGKVHVGKISFAPLRDAKVVIEQWRSFYNHQRPHSALGYRPPAVVRKNHESGNTLDRLTSAVATN